MKKVALVFISSYIFLWFTVVVSRIHFSLGHQLTSIGFSKNIQSCCHWALQTNSWSSFFYFFPISLYLFLQLFSHTNGTHCPVEFQHFFLTWLFFRQLIPLRASHSRQRLFFAHFQVDLFVHIISGTRDQQQQVTHDTDRAVEEKMAIILDVFV